MIILEARHSFCALEHIFYVYITLRPHAFSVIFSDLMIFKSLLKKCPELNQSNPFGSFHKCQIKVFLSPES